MKQYLLILSMLLLITLPSNTEAQEFENGEIGILLSNFGRVRILAPDLNTRQIDRFSILVGGETNQVFDYLNDAESVDSARNIDPPTMGDFELYVSTDNAYSGLPPNVGVILNVYGYNSGGFALAKFTVVNNESGPLNAKIGFEILPQIDGLYGFETVEYDAESGVIRVHVDNASTNVGLKLLSHDLESLRSFAWFDGYNDSDVDLYNHLYYGMIDTLFASDDSGSVAIVGTPNEMIDPGDTITCYVGIAVGGNEMEMMFNMADVQAIYESLITGVEELSEAKPESYELYQNYPNPFNPATKIEFSIPEESDVSLTVYNSLGERVTALINENLPAGKYSSSFNASDLSSGVYFYRLTAGSFSATNKMILIK